MLGSTNHDTGATLQSTLYLVQHLGFVLNRQADQVLKEQLGVGVAQYKLMTLLARNPALPQRALADGLGQTEASISRQIKLLTEKQLLTSRINPRNRRIHLTVLTAKGKALTEAAEELLQRAFEPYLQAISTKQQGQLNMFMQTLHQSVCDKNALIACNHQYEG